MSKTIKYDTMSTTSRDFAMPVEETVSHDDGHPFTPNVEDPRFCADCGLLLVDHGDAPKSSELTFDEAIKWAQEWQDSSELAIPAEIVTGLVDGALALKAENEDLKGRNATQEESITHLQSQFRVMKEAIEAALDWFVSLGYDDELVAQLRSAIAPKGSQQ